jgi:hypothetical protein
VAAQRCAKAAGASPHPRVAGGATGASESENESGETTWRVKEPIAHSPKRATGHGLGRLCRLVLLVYHFVLSVYQLLLCHNQNDKNRKVIENDKKIRCLILIINNNMRHKSIIYIVQ